MGRICLVVVLLWNGLFWNGPFALAAELFADDFGDLRVGVGERR